MHQDRPGEGLAGKQLGIKGYSGPGGQVRCEPAMCPCQEGQLYAGCQTQTSQQAKGNDYTLLASICERASGEHYLVLGSPAQGQPAHSGTSPTEDH